MPTLTSVIVICHDIHRVDEHELRLGRLPEVGEIITINKREWEVLLWIEGNAVPERVIHVAPANYDDPLGIN